jgi:hypothetical protein
MTSWDEIKQGILRQTDDWNRLKSTFTEQKSDLDKTYTDSNITNKVTEMNTALERYTSRAGISSSPDSTTDSNYNRAQEIFIHLSDGIKRYTEINKNLSKQIANMYGSSDIQSKLYQVGQIRQELPRLEKELKDTRNDLETSRARQENTDKPEQNLSFYQGFSSMVGFTRPIKKVSIPILIGFGILLLFLSGLMLREFFSPAITSSPLNAAYATGGVMSMFTDSRFYSVLAGATLVFVATGILAFYGYLGKTVK